MTGGGFLDSDGDEDVVNFEARLRKLPSEKLDRDLTETNYEIEFVEEQIRVDLQSYSSIDLQNANEKLSILKRKGELLKIELAARQNSS
jgi:hypothetical protein